MATSASGAISVPARFAGPARSMGQVRQAVALLRAASAEIGLATAGTLAELAALFSRAERVAAAGMLRCTRTLGDTGARRVAGRKDAATFLSELSGSPLGKAKAGLVAAGQLETAPEAAEAFANGELSLDQAGVLGPAAAARPEEAGALLEAARKSSFRELRAEAARTLRRARRETDQVDAERRAHARRYCRTWVDGSGAVRLDALLSPVDGARLRAALEKATDGVADDARRAGVDEPRERFAADALVRLVGPGRQPGAARGAHVVVRVDAAALVRGDVRDGETCEIDGVGPVSVEAARSLIGEGFLTMLVTDGVDVRTVTSTTRVVPKRVRVALEQRDRACVVPGCGVTEHLEIDHWRADFARVRRTELDLLCRLCWVHHALKTRHGWQLLGGPGAWTWRPPRAVPGRGLGIRRSDRR